MKMWQRLQWLVRLGWVLLLVVSWSGCNRVEPGSPEAVADAFCDAYFRKADQVAAKRFTALGVSRLLDREIRDTKSLRADGYGPADAKIEVGIARGPRSKRNDRIRFLYTIRHPTVAGAGEKKADVELAKIAGEWKVVRLNLERKGKELLR
jgi:hypothetical protein